MIINLNTVDRVKKFCDAVSKFDSDVDAIKERYIIDAKSMLGIFALDLRGPIVVEIHSKNEEEIQRFIAAIDEFKV